MKIKLLKNVLCMLLISSMALTLFSCGTSKSTDTEKSSKTESITDYEKTTNKVIYKTTDYRYGDYNKVKDFEIIKVGDECRLVFNDPGFYEWLGNLDRIGVSFDSIKELRDGLIYGTFTEGQKQHIFLDLPKDEHGISIPDPNNLYIPVLPNDCSAYDSEHSVSVYGSSYGHYMRLVSNKYDINLESGVDVDILTHNDYNEKLQKETELFKNIADSLWTHENGKDSIIYPLNESKKEHVRYTISSENKTMFVIENYTHLEEKKRIDNTIAFYVSNGVYFAISFYGDFFTNESPADPEWLFEFDVEKYVPENC